MPCLSILAGKNGLRQGHSFCKADRQRSGGEAEQKHGQFSFCQLSSAESRLCAYLLREMEECVYRGTLAKAALATGMSYRHLQRIMIHLCKEGVIKKEPDGYHVLDADELDRRIHG